MSPLVLFKIKGRNELAVFVKAVGLVGEPVTIEANTLGEVFFTVPSEDLHRWYEVLGSIWTDPTAPATVEKAAAKLLQSVGDALVRSVCPSEVRTQ